MPRRRPTPAESVEEMRFYDQASSTESAPGLPLHISGAPEFTEIDHSEARFRPGAFHSFVFEEMAEMVFDSGNARTEFIVQPTLREFALSTTSTKEERARFERMQMLIRATDRVIDATRAYRHLSDEAVGHETSIWGSRGHEYLSGLLDKKAKRLTTAEVIDSPIPVCMRELKQSRYKDLPGLCRGFFTNQDKTKVGWECSACSMRPPVEVTFIVRNAAYCAEHVPDLRLCELCGVEALLWTQQKQFDKTTVILCRSCTTKTTHCARCSSGIPLDYLMTGECPSCVSNPEPFTNSRRFSRSNKFIGETPGTVLRSLRMVGIEIEAGSPIPNARLVLTSLMPVEFGISGDGSIRLPNPFEVQTARLAGKAGEDVMNDFGGMLRTVQATVNESCGLHVHLDCSDIIPASPQAYPKALIQLWKMHIVFEDVILSFLPFSRRRNEYCRSLAQMFKLSEVQLCRNLLDCEKLWYQESRYMEIQSSKNSSSHISRYFGINLHSLLAQKHLEIRYHSGTTNIRKMLEWANLHALIVDAAAEGKFTPDMLSEAGALSSMKEKTDLLFKAIGLTEKSRQYFQHRQQKFMDRNQPETSIKPANS